MKTIKTFTVKKRQEKAILVFALIEETGKEETFWLPVSKITESENEILIEEEFWNLKLDELKNPKEPETVRLHSKSYDKGEKATKITVEVLFNEKAFDLFMWFPNSQIEDMKLSQDEEEHRIYIITIAKWIWESGYEKALTKQLEYYNKDEQKYSKEDFTLISQLS